MWIKDWWNRILAKFKKEESVPETEMVMELKPEEAPEPVPERKTSDEMIVEMAETTLQEDSRSFGEPERSEEPAEPESAEDPAEADSYEVPAEPDDSEFAIANAPDDAEGPDVLKDPEGQEGPDPAAEETEGEADEEDESEDTSEEC